MIGVEHSRQGVRLLQVDSNTWPRGCRGRRRGDTSRRTCRSPIRTPGDDRDPRMSCDPKRSPPPPPPPARHPPGGPMALTSPPATPTPPHPRRGPRGRSPPPRPGRPHPPPLNPTTVATAAASLSASTCHAVTTPPVGVHHEPRAAHRPDHPRRPGPQKPGASATTLHRQEPRLPDSARPRTTRDLPPAPPSRLAESTP